MCSTSFNQVISSSFIFNILVYGNRKYLCSIFCPQQALETYLNVRFTISPTTTFSNNTDPIVLPITNFSPVPTFSVENKTFHKCNLLSSAIPQNPFNFIFFLIPPIYDAVRLYGNKCYTSKGYNQIYQNLSNRHSQGCNLPAGQSGNQLNCLLRIQSAWFRISAGDYEIMLSNLTEQLTELLNPPHGLLEFNKNLCIPQHMYLIIALLLSIYLQHKVISVLQSKLLYLDKYLSPGIIRNNQAS